MDPDHRIRHSYVLLFISAMRHPLLARKRSRVGFIAFLGGPVTIGFSGEHYGFRTTFMALALFPITLALTVGLVLRWFERARPPAEATEDTA